MKLCIFLSFECLQPFLSQPSQDWTQRLCQAQPGPHAASLPAAQNPRAATRPGLHMAPHYNSASHAQVPILPPSQAWKVPPHYPPQDYKGSHIASLPGLHRAQCCLPAGPAQDPTLPSTRLHSAHTFSLPDLPTPYNYLTSRFRRLYRLLLYQTTQGPTALQISPSNLYDIVVPVNPPTKLLKQSFMFFNYCWGETGKTHCFSNTWNHTWFL